MLTWQAIGGWFDYDDLYDEAVERAPSDRPSLFVEVGSFLGRSAAYMGAAILRSGKPITLHCVDRWDDNATDDELYSTLQQMVRDGKPIYGRFVDNMVACGLADVVKPVRCLSVDGALLFIDRSCDFVFIDADHKYHAVRADVSAWLPKVAPGGILAGHDWNRSEVYDAVTSLIPLEKLRSNKTNCSWIYNVPIENVAEGVVGTAGDNHGHDTPHDQLLSAEVRHAG